MAKEKTARKKLSAKILTCIIAPLLAILWGVSIALPLVAALKYDLVFRDIFGEAGSGAATGDVPTDGVDATYYKSDFSSIQELETAEQKYTREGGAEGFVLLYNSSESGKGLPIAKNSKLSLFSQTSVDILAGGTGSGVSTISSDMRTALTEQGFTINEALWNYYKGSGKARGGGAIMYGGSENWSLNETPIGQIPQDAKTEATGTTPVFFFGRTGGEGRDLGRYMGDWTQVEEDKTKHYLEPDSVELGVIRYLNENFDNVIIVVNTNNAFELGWIKDYNHITAVLWAPGAGGDTCRSIADVLSGNINPSGHLVDTFAYDAFSSPAMQNMGDVDLVNGGRTVGNGLFYDEGIYVGYKYYETRYFDKQVGAEKVGTYDYGTTVQYPFGYGLSYTTFEWSNFSMSEPDANKDIEISVDVKNTGSVAGKEVVEVYLNAPYTDYDKTNHIEKSAVTLVGFEKTATLEPNASETVKIKVNQRDLISYDDVNAKTYILEAGDYLLTAAHNAHEAANNFLVYGNHESDGFALGAGDKAFVGKYTYSYTENGGVDKTTYSKSLNGTEITNEFDHALWAGHTNITERTQYLTRQDWEGTFPKTHGNQNSQKKSSFSEKNGYVWEVEVDQATADQIAKVGADASLNPMSEAEAGAKAGVFGQEGTLELIDFRGKDFDELDKAGMWDKLIDQMKTTEIQNIIRNGGYQTLNAASINKPRAIDFDGPSGLNEGGVTHSPYSITYPCAANIAASWNRENSRLHGYYVSEDALHASETSFGSHQYKGIISGWYAPAMNIHRTPFAGRNFEYYSEDGFMSGEMALQAARTTAEKGVYSYIKHFALNDQEDHRSHVATFANEQAIREIYLKPFQTCIEERGMTTITVQEFDADTGSFVKKEVDIPAVMGVMTAFNRVGCTWAGGNYQLITKVLREEWGFNGSVITDYDGGGVMNTEQCIRAGGDLKLTAQGGQSIKMKDAATQYYARQAMKHVLYTTVNSNIMNGFIHGTVAADLPFAYYWLIIIAVWVITLGLTAWGVTAIVFRFRSEGAQPAAATEGDGPSDDTPTEEHNE